MSELNIDGWNIEDALFADPPNVNVTHRLFEGPNRRFAVVLYHINEYRNGTEIARLAVFADRPSPRLLLKQPEVWWHANPLRPAVSWISEAALVVGTAARREMPLVVVDIEREQFCFLHVPRGDMCTVRLQEGVVSLSGPTGSDTSSANCPQAYDRLHWFGFDRFVDFFKAYEESATLHGIPTAPVRQGLGAAVKNAFECVMYILIFGPLLALDWLERQFRGRY